MRFSGSRSKFSGAVMRAISGNAEIGEECAQFVKSQNKGDFN